MTTQRVPNYIFSEHGPAWKGRRGTVHNAPAWTRGIVIDSIHAQWMQTWAHNDEIINKNHMTWRVHFAAPVTHPATREELVGATISVESNDFADEDDIVDGVSPLLKCGKDFTPGIILFKMIQRGSRTSLVVHTREYPVRDGATVGQFLDSILNRQMHKFLFNYYTPRDVVQGCGYFTLHTYQVWLRDGLITDPRSIQAPHNALPADICETYFPGGLVCQMPIGRGQFTEFTDPTILAPNDLVPAEVWTEVPTRVDLVLSGVDVDAYYLKEWKKVAELKSAYQAALIMAQEEFRAAADA